MTDQSPELKQFSDLSAGDFVRYPVWVHVHNVDYGKPWYEGTDEETFRPWTEPLPPAGIGVMLVRAEFQLRDGSRYAGFITPASEGWDKPPQPHLRARQRHVLGLQQPRLFVGGHGFSFWGGLLGIREENRQAFYKAIDKTPEHIFPITFQADSSLAAGELSGVIEGFYRQSRKEGLQIER